MSEIRITKNDVIWSYVAQFFNLGVGFITLPVILKMLDMDEIGLNYILISINSVIVLFDMGFSSQFGKNITYILSGAQTIEKKGISSDYKDTINEKLLVCVLVTAKKIYNRLSFIAMVPLLTLGSYYIWQITDQGTAINNIVPIWSIFCLSCFFNLYFLYYTSFLQGRGLVKEVKQGQIISRVIQILIMLTMLFNGCGLLSVVIANLIAPFAFRYYARLKFFDDYIKSIIKRYPIEKRDIKEVFKILLYNAKKIGFIGVLSSALGYASTLIIGAFLALPEVGSYGVMIQLLGIIGGVSSVFFYSITPELSQYMVTKQYERLRMRIGFSIMIFIVLQILGFIVMLCAPVLFRIFRFETQLPSYVIIIIFFIYKFLDQNQSLFSQLLLIENNLVFYTSAIWTGIISIFLQFILLYCGYGLLGIFFAQMIPLCMYSAWKWPLFVSRLYDISIIRDIVKNPLLTIKSY